MSNGIKKSIRLFLFCRIYIFRVIYVVTTTRCNRQESASITFSQNIFVYRFQWTRTKKKSNSLIQQDLPEHLCIRASFFAAAAFFFLTSNIKILLMFYHRLCCLIWFSVVCFFFLLYFNYTHTVVVHQSTGLTKTFKWRNDINHPKIKSVALTGTQVDRYDIYLFLFFFRAVIFVRLNRVTNHRIAGCSK